jgi:hypothetical protein
VSTFITAAKCSQCGGNLDPSTLHCPYCDTSYKINWKSVTTTTQTATVHRDQLVDAVIITAIQKAATTKGIQTDFCTFTNKDTSELCVMVKNKKGNWIQIAFILASQNGYSIELAEGYTDITHQIESCLEWSDCLDGGRFYTLSHYDMSLERWSETHIRGEDELLEHLSTTAEQIFAAFLAPIETNQRKRNQWSIWTAYTMVFAINIPIVFLFLALLHPKQYFVSHMIAFSLIFSSIIHIAVSVSDKTKITGKDMLIITVSTIISILLISYSL